jgi:hypothetical protein
MYVCTMAYVLRCVLGFHVRPEHSLPYVLPYDESTRTQIFNVPMYIGVTVLLSLTVFMMVVADSIPRTSEATPLLGTSNVIYINTNFP